MMRRLEGVENEYLKYKIVNALGGFTAYTKNTRVLFCKDTFDYPELEGHELLCNHLAPKLKGRPRGKRKKRSVSPGSESNESESSVSNVFNSSKEKITAEGGKNGLRCDSTHLRRSTRATENSESKEFIKDLTVFMKTNYTPIGKIPSLGYKELDLYSFYTKVQKLGGYDSVTANRLWKSIFDDMSGHANSTSAATVIRRHYERFLLPYERHVKGEEYKPLPISERRRLKSKTGSSTSDAETSESTSRSGNSTPVPQGPNTVSPVTPTTPTENKEFNIQIKSEGKTSSLRSVRVKPERQKDKQINSDKLNNIQNNNNNNEISSTEVKESIKTETDNKNVKTDNNNLKTEIVKAEAAIVPEKDAEPLTSAVAPIAQKLNPEKSHSPVEGKENIPIIKTGDTPANSKSPEIIEVPYKPKSPEIIDLESDTYTTTSLHQPFLHEVKKRKLDILKEGGLEVTPVRPFASPTAAKDVRPSVIQPTGAQIVPKPNKSDINNMPPPPINTVPPKRLQISVPQALNVSQVKGDPATINNKTPPKSFPYVNGNGPPKVLQSKSIYSYSEKTVYGNPKDYMMPPVQPVHTPKFVGVRHSGGDILDLTVTSPQKPVVEIMKIPTPTPQMPSYNASTRIPYRPTPTPPLLDCRRLGSNLEITLVGSNKPTSVHNQTSSRYSQKRISTENYVNHKIPRIEENGKYNRLPQPIASVPILSTRENKSGMEISIPHPYGPRNPPMKVDAAKMPPQMPSVPNSKHIPTPNPSPFPYLSHLYDSNKSVPPYMHLLDPIYYTAAMQSLYPHNPLNATPPVLPFSSSEQLNKFYTDLMAHNSRLNFPFPVGSDGNPSIINNNSLKKP
ncbi:AT-rich interactive domain-containing protein 5B [Asbolus verrucosus]|uniref:AT-rich interactive domain-containing protein 5B n=1 Tax=Asbolus verrucosus TaxID=1661398 RepID=A0A482VWJ4_ASBVE|nr:AT-rich interactive domain-containing protein 5B [Asbolus verrucosus]